jgi:flagellar assembly factor FliW
MLPSLQTAPAGEAQPVALPSETIVVETRFGTYEFTREQTVMFPRGLVGFPDQRLFGLGNLPAPVPDEFKLLQSLEEVPISFIVLPVANDKLPIESADIKTACDAVGFDPDEIHVMFLCTICPQSDGQGIDIWANIRAPILTDLEARQARQYVLRSDRYPLRQPLDKWNEEL